jgi:hypothetical protein
VFKIDLYVEFMNLFLKIMDAMQPSLYSFDWCACGYGIGLIAPYLLETGEPKCPIITFSSCALHSGR